MKFLFVEDEAELREIYTMLLDDIKVNYQIVCDGSEALDLLKFENFDYIFSDIKMPKMDGFQLLAHLRSKGIKYKKFTFISAYINYELEYIKSLGADDILYKPINHRELIKLIEKLACKKKERPLTEPS